MTVFVLCSCTATSPQPPGYALTIQELELAWKLVPHRLSLAELRALAPSADKPWTFATQQNGGVFGNVDRYGAKLGYALVSAPGLRAHHGHTTISIPGGRSESAATVTVDLGEAHAAAALVPLLRGFRISTDEYVSPPSWTDRYDPAQGFTSTGVGIRLHDLERSGDQATFTIAVAVRLAPCDRENPDTRDDMNGTVPLAETWVDVDYSLLVAPQTQVTTGAHEYFVSYSDFGKNGIHVAVPPPTERRQLLQGHAGFPVGLVALQGFDLLANDPQDKDPSCPILQTPECKGSGRYLQILRAAIRSIGYDATTGLAEVEHHHLISNDAPDGTKTFEQGTMCARVRGDVALLQLPAGSVSAQSVSLSDLHSGERTTQQLAVCGQLPADVPCP